MNKREVLIDKNIYLVGFMGVGKSTVGRIIADNLGFEYIDTDRYIEEKEGLTIREIFEQKGEPYFRELEYEFIKRGHPKSRCVISCGGGLVIPKGMLELLKSKGKVICLSASPEKILERVKHRKNRPLLEGENLEEKIKELLDKRQEVYDRVGIYLSTDERPATEIARHIIQLCSKQSVGS